MDTCRKGREHREDLLNKLSMYNSVDGMVLKHESGVFKVMPRSVTPWSTEILWDYQLPG